MLLGVLAEEFLSASGAAPWLRSAKEGFGTGGPVSSARQCFSSIDLDVISVHSGEAVSEPTHTVRSSGAARFGGTFEDKVVVGDGLRPVDWGFGDRCEDSCGR
jgi:hypothetical protein